MPTRNSRKEYAPDSYYHAYSRGVNKQPVFIDDQDSAVFLNYLKRYLTSAPQRLSNYSPLKSFADEIDLLCYCLMTNHVHLLFYQHDNSHAIADLLQRVLTTYSMYFNRKYHRVGPVFQGRYLASRIGDEAYLYHISRYIHLNPRDWRSHKFSSLKYYTDNASADWIKPRAILELFDNSPTKYLEFLRDYDNSSDHCPDYLANTDED